MEVAELKHKLIEDCNNLSTSTIAQHNNEKQLDFSFLC